MSDTKSFLGKRIKELRKGCQLSQEQLAERVDVDPRYISRIELGKCFPSLDTLERIATSLSVEMRELFEYGHLMSPALATRQEIDKLLEGADEQERQLILRITKAVTRAVATKV